MGSLVWWPGVSFSMVALCYVVFIVEMGDGDCDGGFCGRSVGNQVDRENIRGSGMGDFIVGNGAMRSKLL